MKLSFHNSANVLGIERLLDFGGTWHRHSYPVRYGLLDHPKFGLILIDTGYGNDLFSTGHWRVSFYRNFLRPKLLTDGDALTVVRALGAKAHDVRHIILTHLHADHICGLVNFPAARLYVSAQSLRVWQGKQSSHGFFPQLMPAISSREICVIDDLPQRPLPWGGFGLDVLGDGSALAVNLPGHMIGHVGVYFPQLAQPVFHAADVDWSLKSLMSEKPATWIAAKISDDPSACSKSRALVRLAAAQTQISLCHDDSAA
jgi:glyoxylase-like metal-dependent hydrolase (beta-lactamase superfamily II)